MQPDAARRADTLAWLREAEGDLRAAAVDPGADPPLVDDALPEGATVAVLATPGDETFEVDAETKRVLLTAIEQCRNGQTTPMADLLADLRRRG